MNKIRENMNNFVTCTAYRDGKPVTSWAKCVRMDGTHYWKTVEWGAGLTSTTIQRREVHHDG